MPHNESDRRGATEKGYTLDTRFKEPRVRVTMFFEPEMIETIDKVMLEEGYQTFHTKGRTKFFQDMFNEYARSKGYIE